ncbi:hypothetical protein GUITHDRAFT_105108 [Guillardia theta CCMP2712]|uniref:Lsm14-like N-terminal domain-containing protein n=1 Tax=Guillardia theta (strain CCMP2712) TaxID=905079 RepID=L1JL13_GUITC|nr:hypothetical protein GUITHDRAFT_105108 [Guillardia theta CCMP2712]EKX49027.1 hypothetical protein GUITHDRAFT_105108 [Guillardia theta CCMP2712]|eukprot:XP_005836007.1 hypothetical protein GUITHDRAFT_105108 [Guillardia theta CCMP2712]
MDLVPPGTRQSMNPLPMQTRQYQYGMTPQNYADPSRQPMQNPMQGRGMYPMASSYPPASHHHPPAPYYGNVAPTPLQPVQRAPSQSTSPPPIKIGSVISLKLTVPYSELRYEGILEVVNPTQSTVQLGNVRCLGDEGRRGPDSFVAPSEQIYERIVFRSQVKHDALASRHLMPWQDIKDIHVLNPSLHGPARDPAIVSYQVGTPNPPAVSTSTAPVEKRPSQSSPLSSQAANVSAPAVQKLPPWSNPGDGLRLFKPGQDTSKFVGNDRRQSAYADYNMNGNAPSRTGTFQVPRGDGTYPRRGVGHFRKSDREDLHLDIAALSNHNTTISVPTDSYNATESFWDTISRDDQVSRKGGGRFYRHDKELETFGMMWRTSYRGRSCSIQESHGNRHEST